MDLYGVFALHDTKTDKNELCGSVSNVVANFDDGCK